MSPRLWLLTLFVSAAAYGQTPSISTLSPDTRYAGLGSFTLQAFGSNFNQCTRLRWNGAEQTTTFTAGTTGLLSATIAAGLTASPGTATVTAIRYPFSVLTTALLCNFAGVGVVSNPQTFTILKPLQWDSTSPLTAARRGTPYSTQLQASGGQGQLTFRVLSSNPTLSSVGLSLSAGGLLSGTPTQATTVQMSLEVRDSCQIFLDSVRASSTSCPAFVSQDFTLVIDDPPLVVSTSSLPSGAVCVGYTSPAMEATGGSPPYAFTASGLPPGLTFDSSKANIVGTPSQQGTFQVAITVRDARQRTANRALPLVIAAQSLQLVTTSLPAGTINVAYTTQLNATGGQTPYVFAAVDGTPPPGLTLAAASGAIAGTPTQLGTFNTTYRVTDAQQCTAQRTLPITINPPNLQITTATLQAGRAGEAYSQLMQGSGGTSPFAWSATGLPAGLSINGTTGVIAGTTNVAGTFDVTVTLADSSSPRLTVNRSYQLLINASPVTIGPDTLATGTVGAPYSQLMQASGGVSPFLWSASGLPAPLTINSATGAITGTPAAAGTSPVTITVSDSSNPRQTVNRAYQLTISANAPTISPDTIPAGRVGQTYSAQLTATASGGTSSTFTWSISAGTLPTGVSLNPSTGALAGTPTQAGTFPFTVSVRDQFNQTGTRQYTLQITGLPVIAPDFLPSGRVGAPYSQALTVSSGGTPPFAWAISSGSLPPGVTLNPQTGILGGTPTLAGPYSFTVRVQDGQNQVGTKLYGVEVGQGLTISPEALPGATVGQPYSVTFSATGGATPFRWLVIGAPPPPGLLIDPASGILSGTPTQAGQFQIQIQATDAAGATATVNYALTIGGEFRITTETLAAGQVGTLYNVTLAAIGGRPPYRWSIQAPPFLPAGLILNSDSGQLLGTPIVAGEFQVTFFAIDQSRAESPRRTYTIVIRPGFGITPETLPPGTINQAYSQTLTASGGATPIAFSVAAGTLPPGLSLSNAGVISGTPTQAGESRFTVLATDNNRAEARREYTLTIRALFQISLTSLPAGEVRTAYQQVLSATGGSGNLTWAVSEGSLPPGLELVGTPTTATLRGTPTQEGSFDFTIRVTDAGNQNATQRFTMQIVGPLTVVTQSLPGATPGTAYQAALEASGGEPPYAWAVSAGNLPAGLTLNGEQGVISGTPTAANTFNFTVRVTDRGGRNATRALSIQVQAGLSITTATLPNGMVGVAYSQLLAASGGVGNRTWSISAGNLPAGLQLAAATGQITGVPRQDGTSNFTVRAEDSQGGSATRQLSINVAQLPLGNVTLGPDAARPGDQQDITLNLSTAAATDINGTLTLGFNSDANGARDPALAFASNNRNTVNFVVRQGQTRAVIDGGRLAVGTIAGTITITASLNANGVPITPNPAPSLSIRLARSAPVISAISARKAGNQVTVQIDGFATGREVTSGEFVFTTVGGTANVPLTQVFNTWYTDQQSLQFGSGFRLIQPFTITGDPNQVTGVTVTLVNSVGRSESRQVSIQ